MPQRLTSCLSLAPVENYSVKAKYSSCSPRRTGMDKAAKVLPVYFQSSSISRRSASEKLVHLIPFLVFLCFLTLWRFSYPVNLVMKDGKIVAINHLKIRQPVNNNHVELTILASTISPVAPLPQGFTTTNHGTQEPANSLNKTAH